MKERSCITKRDACLLRTSSSPTRYTVAHSVYPRRFYGEHHLCFSSAARMKPKRPWPTPKTSLLKVFYISFNCSNINDVTVESSGDL